MADRKDFIFRIIGEQRGLVQTNRAMEKTETSMHKLAIRAAAVIPLWVAMRAAIFAIPKAIGAMTNEWLTFQTEMSRVATVTRTTTEGIGILETSIKNLAATSKVGFKDVASVVYALGSAGLTATQQLQGFEHVVNTAVGTGGNLEQTAKLMAGAVNVFGKSMKDATTAEKQFKKVSDIISYTYSCYTPDTEVLTDQGWKLFTDLDKTEKMATLEPNTHKLIYQKPYEYVNQPFEGNLHHIKGRFVDIMVTPNHKLYAKMGQSKEGDYKLIEAQEAHGKYKSFYRGSNWHGEEPSFFTLPAVENKTGDSKEKQIPINIWIRFLAWYLAEGYSQFNNKDTKHPIYRVILCQSSKSKYLKDLEEVLDKIPFHVSRWLHPETGMIYYSINNKQLAHYLKQFGVAKEKFIPNIIKNLSKDLLRLFIKTYAYGDGSIAYTSKNNIRIGICTGSKQMRDDFMEIALKADYGATYHSKVGGFNQHKQNPEPGWGISFCERTEFLLRCNNGNEIKNHNEELIPYKGNVVCVEIPNHILFVRRNGKSFWCGNTQQVELAELATALGYVASVGTLVDIEFEELVTTIGVLNTGMLKGCVSEDTELLTDQGWKFFKDLDKTEKVATLNPNTKELEYQTPSRYIDYEYKGRLLHQKNTYMDTLLTPNHRIYAKPGKKKSKDDYTFTLAENIKGTSNTYNRGCKWLGEDEQYFTLPSVDRHYGGYDTPTDTLQIDMGDWVEFMGWFLSEGCAGGSKEKDNTTSYKTIIYQEKSETRKKLQQLLDKLPFKYYTDGKSYFAIRNKQLAVYLEQFGLSYQKYIPDFIKQLTPELLKRFIITYSFGDGRLRGMDKEIYEITTASVQMRDDLMEVGLKAGYGVSYAKYEGISSFKQNHDIWKIYMSTRTEFNFNQKANEYLLKYHSYKNTTKEEWVEYDGKVYCVEVPNSIILIRRNGKTIWTGNSKSGTSLVNAFIQLARKSERLSELGITIDTSKPLDFLEVMDKLQARFEDNKLSLEDLSRVMATFGIRGGRAVGLLLTNYEVFKKSLKDTKTQAEDFGKIMRVIAEDNIPAAATKIKNSFTAIWMDVLDDVKPPFMNFLTDIQDQLDKFRAHQEVLKLSGKTTAGAALATSAPQFGIGAAAFFAGRALPGRNRLLGISAEAEERSIELSQKAISSRLIQQQPRGAGGRFRPYTQQEKTAAIQRTGITPRLFRGQAQAELGQTRSGLSTLGRTLALVGKYALVAIGGLKIIQGLLNQFAPDALGTKLFNKGLNGALSIISNVFVSMTETMYYFYRGLKEVTKDTEIQLNQFLESLQSMPGIVGSIITKMRSLGTEETKEQRRTQIKETIGVGTASTFASLTSLGPLFTNISTAINKFVSHSTAVGKEKADKEHKSELAATAFYRANQKLFQELSLTLGGEGKEGLSIIESTRKLIEEEKLKKAAESAGFVDFKKQLDKLNATFDASNKDKNATTAYTEGVIKVLIALEKAINSLTFVDETFKASLKKKVGVAGITEEAAGAGRGGLAKTVLAMRVGAKQLTDVTDVDKARMKAAEETSSFQAKLTKVIADSRADSKKLYGASDESIALDKLENKLKEFLSTKGEAVKKSGEELTVSDLLVENYDKINRISEKNTGIRETLLALQKEGLDVTLKQQKAIQETGSYVKGAFKDVFLDIFRVEDVTFDSLAKKFGDALKNAWQDQFSDIFAQVATNLTGLDSIFGGVMRTFGDIFKEATSPIAQAHIDGITAGAQIIINAHQAGITGKGTTTTATGGIGGAIGKIIGPSSIIGKFLSSPIFKASGSKGYYSPIGGDEARFRNMGRVQTDPFDAYLDTYTMGTAPRGGVFDKQLSQYQNTPGRKKRNPMTYGQAIGAGVQGAMAGYSTYQAAGGSEGGAMAIGAGVLSAYGAAAMMVPGGQVVGGIMMLGGMLMSAFNKPEAAAFKQEEVREQTTQIASRIDITNNALEWVNRNLVDLRREITYIMRESFYFSERSETDSFAIDATRGAL